MPKVSVVIPVYNGVGYLRETLDSILGQSFADFEVVCVDDSSTDRSLELLNEYAQKDSRIKVFSKPNQGLASYSVAYGLERAQGEYYMYSSQDDLYSPDLLEKGVAKAIETGADLIQPNLICYFGDGSDRSMRTFWQENVADPEHTTPHQAFVLSLDWRIHGFMLVRTELARKVGIDTSNYNSDEYTCRKLLLSCSKIAFSDGIFYYRIDNPNAITKKMSPLLFDVFDTNRRLEALATEQKVAHSTMVRLRELALNDVAIRQKFLFQKGRELTAEQRAVASQKVRQAYKEVSNKKELYRTDAKRRLMFTHGFWLLKLSMFIRAKCSKR